MKTSTLLSIAAQIENAIGIQSRATVNEMSAMVQDVAGHCRSKAEAAEVLATEHYGYAPGEWDCIREVVAAQRK
jgi:hypothetical protein